MNHLRCLVLVVLGLLCRETTPEGTCQEKARGILPAPGKLPEITAGDLWTGLLREEGARDRVRGTVCQVCLVHLEVGKVYQIDMKGDAKRPAYSSALDPYLRLEDPSGRHLDSNDDAPGAYGTSLDARILFPCMASGTYRIIATTFDNGTGAFFLQVSEAKNPPPNR